MLFMALYPCLDAVSVATDDSQLIAFSENLEITSSPSQEEGEHNEGHCSPFCMCHCCHTHIVIGDLSLFSYIAIQSPAKGFLSSLRTDEVICTFLRPPIYA